MRSFTDIKDLSKSDIEAILFRTKQEKKVIAKKGTLDIDSVKASLNDTSPYGLSTLSGAWKG